MSERITCGICGCEIEDDNYTVFDGVILCENCLDRQTSICSECDARIWNDDNMGTRRMPLCRDCYNEDYTTCEDCGRVIRRDDAHYFEYDDYAYCDSCYENRLDCSIHEYSYKPDPIFYGGGNRFFGVELEIDSAGKDEENAEQILDEGNRKAEHIYIKSDGSLDDGMEIVTHPMSLNYHKESMPWDDITRIARSLGYRSHKTPTCGLHIHVNRTTFGETRDLQDECISRVLYFVEHHWEELLKFSRRTESQMNRWAARYGYKNTPKEIMETAKKGYAGRYTCVNITNWNTVEFRMFRGTLKVNTIIATLELVNRICELATIFSDDEIASLSWSDFVSSLDQSENSELITYLKERMLYVNEPIEPTENDD